jgi:hypothetical protein
MTRPTPLRSNSPTIIRTIKPKVLIKTEKRKPSYWGMVYLVVGLAMGSFLMYGYLKTRMWLAADYIADGHPVTAYHILSN